MKIEFRSSFAKDLKSVDKVLALRIRKVIEEVDRAESLLEIANLKKLRGPEISIACASAIIG